MLKGKKNSWIWLRLEYENLLMIVSPLERRIRTPRLLTYNGDSSLTQCLRQYNFRPPKNFGFRNYPQPSSSTDSVSNENSYQCGEFGARPGSTSCDEINGGLYKRKNVSRNAQSPYSLRLCWRNIKKLILRKFYPISFSRCFLNSTKNNLITSICACKRKKHFFYSLYELFSSV